MGVKAGDGGGVSGAAGGGPDGSCGGGTPLSSATWSLRAAATSLAS
jgi:hypothetical protein